jgi:FAD/FMN-containing dehydrogenase
MEAFFANNSCDPFQPVSTPCTLGNYVRYAVNASSVEDIQATLAFTQENNIRFVIRNTGHDYLGRSTGAGALSVWLQHLKGIEILDLDTPGYTGKAVKVGAGVQGREVCRSSLPLSENVYRHPGP